MKTDRPEIKIAQANRSAYAQDACVGLCVRLAVGPIREPGASASRTAKRERDVWQRRFFDYVHVNPLKHGLVERVAGWPWSSFHRYVRLGEYPSEWGSSNDLHGDEFAEYE